MEKKFSISSFNLFSASQSMLDQIADLYAEVWKEPPWNEDFWTVSQVLSDMQKDFTNPDAIGFVAFSDSRVKSNPIEVIGFSWGYQVSREKLREISGLNDLDFLFDNPICKVYYIDELGVSKENRGQGIGRELTQELINYWVKKAPCCITLRTDILAQSARSLYEKLGFKEIPIADAKYPDRTYWRLDTEKKS